MPAESLALLSYVTQLQRDFRPTPGQLGTSSSGDQPSEHEGQGDEGQREDDYEVAVAITMMAILQRMKVT